MKKIPYLIIVLFALVFTTQAQAQKVGYFDLEEILPQVPEYQSAKVEMETYAKQIEEEIKAKQTEFETKLADYQKRGESMTPAIRAAKERELQTLDRNFQEFQQNVQRDIQQREGRLLTPIYEKIEAAIKEVAAQDGYAYILKAEFVSYANEAENISGKVLAKVK